jgi:hypothetical protein
LKNGILEKILFYKKIIMEDYYDLGFFSKILGKNVRGTIKKIFSFFSISGGAIARMPPPLTTFQMCDEAKIG